MSHQIRPGVRGGRDQFSWDQVKEDKQRLNYLGSSIHGMPDKFKKGPETFWYAKETKTIPAKCDKSEIELLKEKENKAMEALLGGSIKKHSVPAEKASEPRQRENSPDRNDRISSKRYTEREYERTSNRKHEKYHENYHEKDHEKYDYRREEDGRRGSYYNRESHRYRRHREDEREPRRYDRARSPIMYK